MTLLQTILSKQNVSFYPATIMYNIIWRRTLSMFCCYCSCKRKAFPSLSIGEIFRTDFLMHAQFLFYQKKLNFCLTVKIYVRASYDVHGADNSWSMDSYNVKYDENGFARKFLVIPARVHFECLSKKWVQYGNFFF